MPLHPLALPPTLSPDALDALTEMTIILARLRAAIQTSSSTGLTGTTPATFAATPSLAASPNGALSLKDIPTATDNLKHKLQRARTQVKLLPDMDRTVEEQESEIQELEAKLKKQTEVLDTFRTASVGFVVGQSVDTKMEL
jgi:small-conductance mechanosensitive channel